MQCYTCGMGAQRTGVPDLVWDWERKASLQNTCLSLLCELSYEQGMKAGLLGCYSHRSRETFAQISQAIVVFKLEWHQNHLVGLLKHRSEPRPQNFWFSRSKGGPEHLHFWQIPQWCWCCYSGGPHSENNWVIGWAWLLSTQNGETYSEARARKTSDLGERAICKELCRELQLLKTTGQA